MDTSILPYNTKECTLCHHTYPATPEYFHRSSKGKYGLVARCKDCISDLQRQYLLTESGKKTRQKYKKSGKGKAAAKKYRSTDSVKQKERKRQSSDEHKQWMKLYAKQYRQTEKSKKAQKTRKAKYRASPEGQQKRQEYNRSQSYKEIAERYRKSEQGRLARKAINSRYRTAKTTAGGTYTIEQFKRLCEHYDNSCACCGKSGVLLEGDHVIPVSSGGTSDIVNIQPLCRTCNSSKGTRVIDYRYKGLPNDF